MYTLLLILLLILLGAVIFFVLFYRNNIIGITFALFVYFLEATNYFSIDVEVSGITITYNDLVYSMMLVVVIVRTYERFLNKKSLFNMKYFNIFIIITVLSAIRGIMTFGTQAAINDVRSFYYYIVIILYIVSYPYNLQIEQKYFKVFRILFYALTILAFVYWTCITILKMGFVDIYNGGNQMRVLYSKYALFVLEMMILFIVTGDGNNIKANKRLVYLSLIMTIVLQQRAVWVCAMVSIVLLFLLVPDKKTYYLKVLRNTAVLVCMAMLFIFVALPEQSQYLVDAFTESVVETVSDDSTFAYRTEGWQFFLTEEYLKTPVAWLLGNPFGYGYERIASKGNVLVNYMPHNYYVMLIARVGIIGLIGYLLFFIQISKLTWEKLRLGNNLDKQSLNVYRLFMIIIAIHLVYYIPYVANIEHGIWIGMLLARLMSDKSCNNQILIES